MVNATSRDAKLVASLRDWARKVLGPGLTLPFLKDLSSVSILRLAGGALLFVAQILLAGWMGAEDFGTYSFAWALVAVLGTVAGLGFAGTSVRFISKYEAEGTPAKLRGLVSFGRTLTVSFGVVTAAVGTILVSLFASSTPYREALQVSFMAVPILALLNLEAGYARGFGWMSLATAGEQILRPLLLIAIGWAAAALINERSAVAFVAACGLAYVFATVAQHFAVNRRIAKRISYGRREFEISAWMHVTVAMLFLNGSQIIRMNTDPVLVGIFLEPTDVGIYTAAIRTATLVSFVLTITSIVAQPNISSLHTRQSHSQLAVFLTSATRGALFASLAMAIFLVVFGNAILSLFGPAFTAGYPALLILVAAHVVAAALGPLTSMLTMTGHQDSAAVIHSLSLLSNAILNLVLIPNFGILGAAAASGTNLVLTQIVLYVIVRRHLRVFAAIPHSVAE